MYMSILHVFHVWSTGRYDFAINLYFKFQFFFSKQIASFKFHLHDEKAVCDSQKLYAQR